MVSNFRTCVYSCFSTEQLKDLFLQTEAELLVGGVQCIFCYSTEQGSLPTNYKLEAELLVEVEDLSVVSPIILILTITALYL